MAETPAAPGHHDLADLAEGAGAAGPAAPVVVESFDQPQLPAPGTAGRIVRVPGSGPRRPGRLWLDDGARWSAVVDQAVDVHAFGAAGDSDEQKDGHDDTQAIQAALNTGEDIYLPRGGYLITQTLLFHDAQTIFGDARSDPYGPGSVLWVRGGIPALRSASYPALTRDVLIRDLLIYNKDTSPPPGGSAGIDFTGVGNSRIERVGIRYHESGIIGRDSTVFSTTVRADSSGTVLKVAAPYPPFTAAGRQVVVTDGTTASPVTIVRQAGSSDPDYPALLLQGPLQVTYHTGAAVYPSPIGGYYNTVVDCELIGCGKGVWLSHAGNAWTVLDGHVWENDYGIYAENCNGNRFRSTFERNGVGVLLKDALQNVVMSGSYFEGNGVHGKPLEGYGAVLCLGQSARNVIEPGQFSDGGDTVVDQTTGTDITSPPGSNIFTGTSIPAFPAMPSGHSSGRNLLFNCDFVVDSNKDGIADGWAFDAPPPGTFTMKIDRPPADMPDGVEAAQCWTMQKGRNSLRALVRAVAVIPGQWYTFTGLTKVGTNGGGLYHLRIGETPSPTEDQQYYDSGALPEHDDWTTGLHRASFQVRGDVTTIYLLIENTNTGDGVCDAPGTCSAWFGKFQLEPGRGLPTESRDSGLMGEIRTGRDDPLPILQNGTPDGYIQVTHSYHAVSGSAIPIANIYPPPGFSGMVVLRAAGAWHTVTSGSGTGKVGNAFSMTPGKAAIGWYDGGSGTWWFTISA